MTETSTRPLGVNGENMSATQDPLTRDLSGDFMHGADEISEFVFGKTSDEKLAESNRRRIYHAADKHGLPTFKFGGALCARKSTILKWISEQEKVA